METTKNKHKIGVYIKTDYYENSCAGKWVISQ